MDENNEVLGFHLQSTAVRAGMKIGDRVIGIDGLDIKDESLAQHLMGVFPGDSMIYSIFRDGERIDFNIIAISN